MFRLLRPAGLIVLAMTLVFVPACNKGEDTPTGGGGLDTPACDLSGTWFITEEITQTTCPEGTSTSTYNVTITQNGNNLTVETDVGTFSGTISGSSISWTGSYPEEGGTTTINSLSLTVNADCDGFSGSASWSWTDGTDSCSGHSSITGESV